MMNLFDTPDSMPFLKIQHTKMICLYFEIKLHWATVFLQDQKTMCFYMFQQGKILKLVIQVIGSVFF